MHDLEVDDRIAKYEMIPVYTEIKDRRNAIRAFSDTYDYDEIMERYNSGQATPYEIFKVECFMGDVNESYIAEQEFDQLCHQIFDPYLEQMRLIA